MLLGAFLQGLYMATIQKYKKVRDGNISYVARIRIKGHRPITKTFPKLSLAKLWAEQTEEKLIKGVYIDDQIVIPHTLSEAIERLKGNRDHEKRKTAAELDGMLEWFEKEIGSMSVSKISPVILSECRDKLRKQKNRYNQPLSDARVNRYFSALSHLYQFAIQDWGWVDSNPCRKIRKLEENNNIGRALRPEEFENLTKYCKEYPTKPLSIVVMLSLCTGMRRSEIKYLTWEDVDLQNATIILKTTKNNDPRRVPITEPALSLFKEYAKVRRIGCQWCFPSHYTAKTVAPFHLDHQWKDLKEELGLENFRFHDLRHSCASFLAQNGAPALLIAEILGHRTLEMAKRYTHLMESPAAREALEKMNRKMHGG